MKPLASLSLDLDNKWSYMKTHGDRGWESFPSYFGIAVPRFLQVLKRHNLKITVFVVGQDAALPENVPFLKAIVKDGHEIGNHSFHHEPWLHLYDPLQIAQEIARAEEQIERATGQRPHGFRGPGFSVSEAVLEVLAQRGYTYDCSTFPTYLGPLARAYYFFTAKLTEQQKKERALLFGDWREGRRPLKSYVWQTRAGELAEIPVTTMPLFRAPIHFSYVLYLSRYSPLLALTYLRLGLALCRWTGVAPSLLLHPLDFLAQEDAPELGFFPAMQMPLWRKLEVMDKSIGLLARTFEVVPMAEHARRAVTESGASTAVPRLRWS